MNNTYLIEYISVLNQQIYLVSARDEKDAQFLVEQTHFEHGEDGDKKLSENGFWIEREFKSDLSTGTIIVC